MFTSDRGPGSSAPSPARMRPDLRSRLEATQPSTPLASHRAGIHATGSSAAKGVMDTRYNLSERGAPKNMMTITIESDSGIRIKFEVDHEPHFDLRSEEVDRLNSTVRTVENTLTSADDGRMFLALAKVTLDGILEALPAAGEEDE
jgi:hypothetical protein